MRSEAATQRVAQYLTGMRQQARLRRVQQVCDEMRRGDYTNVSDVDGWRRTCAIYDQQDGDTGTPGQASQEGYGAYGSLSGEARAATIAEGNQLELAQDAGLTGTDADSVERVVGRELSERADLPEPERREAQRANMLRDRAAQAAREVLNVPADCRGALQRYGLQTGPLDPNAPPAWGRDGNVSPTFFPRGPQGAFPNNNVYQLVADYPGYLTTQKLTPRESSWEYPTTPQVIPHACDKVADCTAPMVNATWETTRDTRRSTGLLIDPYTNAVFETFEEEMPPPNADYTIPPDQLRLVNPKLLWQQGGYDRNCPPKPRTQTVSPGAPVSGGSSTVYDNAALVEERGRQMYKRFAPNLLRNRNGFLPEGGFVRDRYPVGFVGQQNMLRFYPHLPTTQRTDVPQTQGYEPHGALETLTTPDGPDVLIVKKPHASAAEIDPYAAFGTVDGDQQQHSQPLAPADAVAAAQRRRAGSASDVNFPSGGPPFSGDHALASEALRGATRVDESRARMQFPQDAPRVDVAGNVASGGLPSPVLQSEGGRAAARFVPSDSHARHAGTLTAPVCDVPSRWDSGAAASSLHAASTGAPASALLGPSTGGPVESANGSARPASDFSLNRIMCDVLDGGQASWSASSETAGQPWREVATDTVAGLEQAHDSGHLAAVGGIAQVGSGPARCAEPGCATRGKPSVAELPGTAHAGNAHRSNDGSFASASARPQSDRRPRVALDGAFLPGAIEPSQSQPGSAANRTHSGDGETRSAPPAASFFVGATQTDATADGAGVSEVDRAFVNGERRTSALSPGFAFGAQSIQSATEAPLLHAAFDRNKHQPLEHGAAHAFQPVSLPDGSGSGFIAPSRSAAPPATEPPCTALFGNASGAAEGAHTASRWTAHEQTHSTGHRALPSSTEHSFGVINGAVEGGHTAACWTTHGQVHSTGGRALPLPTEHSPGAVSGAAEGAHTAIHWTAHEQGHSTGRRVLPLSAEHSPGAISGTESQQTGHGWGAQSSSVVDRGSLAPPLTLSHGQGGGLDTAQDSCGAWAAESGTAHTRSERTRVPAGGAGFAETGAVSVPGHTEGGWNAPFRTEQTRTEGKQPLQFGAGIDRSTANAGPVGDGPGGVASHNSALRAIGAPSSWGAVAMPHNTDALSGAHHNLSALTGSRVPSAEPVVPFGQAAVDAGSGAGLGPGASGAPSPHVRAEPAHGATSRYGYPVGLPVDAGEAALPWPSVGEYALQSARSTNGPTTQIAVSFPGHPSSHVDGGFPSALPSRSVDRPASADCEHPGAALSGAVTTEYSAGLSGFASAAEGRLDSIARTRGRDHAGTAVVGGLSPDFGGTGDLRPATGVAAGDERGAPLVPQNLTGPLSGAHATGGQDSGGTRPTLAGAVGRSASLGYFGHGNASLVEGGVSAKDFWPASTNRSEGHRKPASASSSTHFGAPAHAQHAAPPARAVVSDRQLPSAAQPSPGLSSTAVDATEGGNTSAFGASDRSASGYESRRATSGVDWADRGPVSLSELNAGRPHDAHAALAQPERRRCAPTNSVAAPLQPPSFDGPSAESLRNERARAGRQSKVRPGNVGDGLAGVFGAQNTGFGDGVSFLQTGALRDAPRNTAAGHAPGSGVGSALQPETQAGSNWNHSRTVREPGRTAQTAPEHFGFAPVDTRDSGHGAFDGVRATEARDTRGRATQASQTGTAHHPVVDGTGFAGASAEQHRSHRGHSGGGARPALPHSWSPSPVGVGTDSRWSGIPGNSATLGSRATRTALNGGSAGLVQPSESSSSPVFERVRERTARTDNFSAFSQAAGAPNASHAGGYVGQQGPLQRTPVKASRVPGTLAVANPASEQAGLPLEDGEVTVRQHRGERDVHVSSVALPPSGTGTSRPRASDGRFASKRGAQRSSLRDFVASAAARRPLLATPNESSSSSATAALTFWLPGEDSGHRKARTARVVGPQPAARGAVFAAP